MTPYLYAHQNRHAPRRANGLRFHGYPSRIVSPRLIAPHTTESFFDLIGQDTGAENVARFQSTTERPSSYHRIVDRDSTVTCLPDEATAFGIGNLNGPTLHLSWAMRAVDWSDPRKARAAQPALERGAHVAADWAARYDIPLVVLTRSQAFGTHRGFIPHGVADPSRRSDPGRDFPWPAFFGLVRDLIGTSSSPAPSAPTSQEDDMAKLIRANSGEKKIAIIGAPGRQPFEHIPNPEDAAALARAHGAATEVNAREFDLTAAFYGSAVRA